MSKNPNDWLLEDLSVSTQAPVTERSLVQRYLQNPFSLLWSKLAAWFQSTQAPSQSEALENYQSEQYEPGPQERDLYPRFTDRVDPSLYYTIFFPHKRS